MKITSTAFTADAALPAKYTCDGDNVNPPLQISSVPAETKSLLLIVDDPDAPHGDWVHWLLWNIDPKTSEIAENSVPDGAIQGITDFGTAAWGGPCPPSGTHRYFFKLYALDATLEISSSSKKADLEKALQVHLLDSAKLMGNYKRP